MRSLPFTKSDLEAMATKWPTPFHIYDASAISRNAEALKAAFKWNKGFREYFAVKATPNPYILKLLSKHGFGCDCSSLAELVLSEKAGVTGENIMFTSNDTPSEEFLKAYELGAILNLDDISHWSFLLETIKEVPELMCCRYNPGPVREGNAIIGRPEEAKYGMTREQIFKCYEMMRDAGVKRFGIHTMLASNELDRRYIVETSEMLFKLAVELNESLGIKIEFVNIGGGIGIPYKPDEEPVNLELLGQEIREAYKKIIEPSQLGEIALFMECGRSITGPYGYLVSRVLHFKDTYRHYAGLDACMSNLMRPALYGAYHEIIVPGKENSSDKLLYDVTGSLCENNDKFAIGRNLPRLERGDFVVICDAGAHGHAMGFQYNGKLRSAELLLEEDGNVRQIRRAETLDDYFATLSFDEL